MISIIICTYNRCDSLKNTLNSILAQESNGSLYYELIVVDNNSQDKTREVIESYIPQFNGRLKYLLELKQGRTHALNKGLEIAKGEIIAFTDDDCIVDKNWLKNINNVFINKNIDLLGGKIIPFFSNPLPKWLNNYHKENILKHPLIYYDLGNEYIENTKDKILPVGANMSIKKKSVYKFGKFYYYSRPQDIELDNRWHKLGAKIAYSPEVIVYHYTYPNRLNKTYFKKYYFEVGKDDSNIYKEKYTYGRRIFNVPLWVYKELVLSTLKFIDSLLQFNSNNFLKELEIFYYFGIICNLSRKYIDKNYENKYKY